MPQGGHTSEMLKLTSRLSPETYSPLCYVVASTDHTSADRIPKEGLMSGRCRVRAIPRSREVGQSYLTSVFTTLLAALHAAVVVVTVRPDLVLVNGPGTCIPVCVAAFALRFFGLGSSCSRTVFCESFCRVKSLSLSGRIMYLLADRFVVHWPELLVKYPRAEYAGQLV
ncbi:beta(1,4)-N-acetylglucosaminyltransferase [Ectocarpus siliculosus]|uniref:UDP-N-acetylglucosamine transferase subunit ALG14 n=1 Tax=Ectocarpus siliculosus TaxID=2880 RepID=D7FX40_ECTSI|nr:beta(1,4)-N-acetylglucosaminyltransferase [Ectocarpus siliculosus]|eukprot:CBJ26373.1 beta(1,4)-N-acetylglucosaminyltransferase [Ectocarpus siliculosus]